MMTPSDIGGLVRDSLVELAWSQWNAIGVAGGGAKTRAIVDPEALFVASMGVARWDARLFDEVLDWVALNGPLLDTARMRRLSADASPAQRRLVLATIGSVVEPDERGGLRRVEDALLAREETAEYAVEPLFHSDSVSPGDWVPADETFEAFGFRRPAPETRGMSVVPDGTSPPCLRFALRALVGQGARAETLVYLTTHDWAHGRLIAEHAAYNQSVVADYLASLYVSGLALRRVRGRLTEYRLAEPLRSGLLPTPEYVAWRRAWPALNRILEALSDQVSDDALWARLANALDRERDALSVEGLGVDVPPIEGWVTRGPDELAGIAVQLAERCRELAR